MPRNVAVFRGDPDALRAQLDALPEIYEAGSFVGWTPEMDQILLEYWDSGRSKTAIANVLGLSTTTCRSRYAYLAGRKEMTRGH